MKRALCLLLLSVLAPFAFPQGGPVPQYAAFSATNIADAAGNKLLSGTITFTPVSSSGAPISPNMTGGGRVTPATVTWTVTNGVASTSYGALQLVDVTQANPSNFCYKDSIHDNNSGQTWYPDSCVQPAWNAPWCAYTTNGTTSSTSCNFNSYVPTGTPGVTQVAGLPGVNWRGAWSSSNTYAINDGVSYNGSSFRSTIAGNTNSPGTPTSPGTGWSVIAAMGASGVGTDALCHTDGSGNLSCSTVAAGATLSTVSAMPITAAEALLPSGGTLIVNNVLTVSANHTTTTNTSYEIKKGGGFNISAGQVLSLNSTFTAGRYQIFFGTGTVSFASNTSLKEIYPEWWGADPTGVAPSAAAWNAAAAAAMNVNNYGGTISCPIAVYSIENTINSVAIGSTARGVSLSGPDSQINDAAGACSLKWTGVAGGTIWHYLGGHEGVIQNVNFNANGLAARGLWLDVQSTTAASSGIVAVTRSSNSVTIQTATAETWAAGTNLLVSGVTDTSFNGVFPVWYAVDSTHYVVSQYGPNASSSGGTVALSQNSDSNVTINRVNFYTPQSQTASIASCTLGTSLSCTLNTPIIMYPNQWIWLHGATGANGGLYNAYWKVTSVLSPTQFTALNVESGTDSVGITSGTVQGPSAGLSIGANNLANINASAYGILVKESGLDGYGELDGSGNTIWPLAAFEVDGASNTKDFYFRDISVNGARIGWLGFDSGGYDCGDCNGNAVQDSIWASVLGNIHDGDWEQINGAYVVSELPSGSYLGVQLGVTGQFEYPSNTGASLSLTNMFVEAYSFAPDEVFFASAAATTLKGNLFQATGDGISGDTTPNVVNSVVLATAGTGGTPGTYMVTGVGGCTRDTKNDSLANNAVIAVLVQSSGVVDSHILIMDKGGNCTSAPTFTVPGSTATFTVTVGQEIARINFLHSNPFNGYGDPESLTSIGNSYAGATPGGFIPVIAGSTLTYPNAGPVMSAYGGLNPAKFGVPVASIGDVAYFSGGGLFGLTNVQSGTAFKFTPSYARNATITSVAISSGVATVTLSSATPVAVIPYQLVHASGLTSTPGLCLNGKVGTVIAAGLTSTTVEYSGVSACSNASTTADTGSFSVNPMQDAATGFLEVPNNFPFVGARNAANNGDDRLYFDASDHLAMDTPAGNDLPTVTASQVNTLLGTLSGCNVAGNLYSPQSGTCIAPPSGTTKVATFAFPGTWWSLTSNDSVLFPNSPVTITRVYWAALGAAVTGCTTQPIVYVKQGATTLYTLTIPASTSNVDSGVLSAAAVSGTPISVGTTPGAGCTGGANGFSVSVNYQ